MSRFALAQLKRYTSTPTAIEARWSGGSWATIDAAPSGNIFSGTLSSQNAGQGDLEVRMENLTDTTDIAQCVGIGDVFVVAGQSNAQGWGDNLQSYSHATIKASMYRLLGDWAELSDPCSIAANGVESQGSPWPLLATLLMGSEGVPIGFINVAVNGSSLNTDWQPGSGTYSNATDCIDGSGVATVKAILWHQGETDANDSVDRATYTSLLSGLVDDLQSDVPALTGAKMVCAQIGYKTTNEQDRADLDAIRLAQSDAWDSDADILAGPVLFDIGLSDGDGVHIGTGSDSELQVAANRWYRCLLAHFYNGSESATSPRFSTTVRSGTTVTVTFTGGEGNLTGQTDTTGWRFTDDDEAIAIIGSIANGVNAVDLTLSSTPSGVEVISFGSFNDGADTSLRDSGTYPMPPSPFVEDLSA